MRRLAAWLVPLLLASACTERDPFYCDTVQPCPAGLVCLLPQRKCVNPQELRPDLGQCAPPTGAENCANAVDDNGDCLTDCDDPLCLGNASCPGTIIGYGAINGGVGCSGTTVAMGPIGAVRNLNVPTTCSNCRCTSDCSPTDLRVYNSAIDCSALANEVDHVTFAMSGVCNKFNKTLMANLTYAYTAPPPRCIDSGTAGTPDPVSSGKGTLCLPTTLRKDCTSASCVAALSGATSFCVAYEGDVACPPAFPKRDRWYLSLNTTDNRTCKCCTTTPSGTCSASVQVYLDNACGMGGTTVSSSCATNNNIPSSARLSVGSAPTCAQSGTAQGTGPTGQGGFTVCCVR